MRDENVSAHLSLVHADETAHGPVYVRDNCSKSCLQSAAGVNSLPIMDIATMWLVSLAFAMIESAIYPENSSCTKGRTLAWAIVANLCFIGGAWMFGWFAELPLWGKIILVVFLEMGLAMMWFGDQFVLKMDSAQLTKELKQYQKKI